MPYYVMICMRDIVLAFPDSLHTYHTSTAILHDPGHGLTNVRRDKQLLRMRIREWQGLGGLQICC